MNAALESTGRAAAQRKKMRPATTPPSAQPQPAAPEPIGLDRIVLAGFMGSGKTSVGELLAERLGWRFHDLDREIERRDQRSVPAIFAGSGEPHFRRLESAALRDLLQPRQVVLALGGGAPETPENRLLLQQTPHTAVVYLHAPLATLLERCRKDAARPDLVDRPLLAQAEVRFQIRHPIYEHIASHRIETAELGIEQAVAAILKALRSAA